MKLFEIANNNELQKFIITCWGKLLYLDYLSLPNGKNQINNPALLKTAREYLAASEEELEDLDEWAAEGAKLKDGTYLLSRETVDALLHSCETPLDKELTLYRFQSKLESFKQDSWISMTTADSGYSGKRQKYVLPKGTKIIDTHGLADKSEFIVSTNVIINAANTDL
jgi:hypothetical protein